MYKFFRTLLGFNQHINPTTESYIKIPSIGISPLTYGDKVTDFEYTNSKGEKSSLSEITKKSPVIVVFFRGTWCINCQLELIEIQKEMKEFNIKNIKILAISPDIKNNILDFSNKHELSYDLISDTDNKISKLFDIAISIRKTVTKSMIKKLNKETGLHLEQSLIPIPATYIIDKKMSILYNFIDYDFTKRIKVSELAKLTNEKIALTN